jgi:hypothetical protein
MARFRVVNSSPGVYWIEDTVGDPRWTNGMGLTFDDVDGDKTISGKAQADQTCLCLNLLANHGGRDLEMHEKPEDFVNKASLFIKFQSGPISQHGQNGVQIEDVLEEAVTRLRFVNGLMSCRENSVALTHIETALLWLNKRTAERRKQGVEGRHLAHVS